MNERELIRQMRDALSEAIDTHIYSDGDRVPEDCEYHRLVAEADVLLATPSAPAFTPRELATVLAALATFQRGYDHLLGDVPQHIEDIETDGGAFAPLSDAEIDALRERLNTPPDLPRLAIIVDGGMVQDIVTNRPGIDCFDRIVVIDYDTDNADLDDPLALTNVPQGDGTDKAAHIGDWSGEVSVMPGLAEAIRRYDAEEPSKKWSDQ